VIHVAALTTALWKAVTLAAGVGLSMLYYSLAPPSSGGDTVQGLYGALVRT
jgi:hypothetical protein